MRYEHREGINLRGRLVAKGSISLARRFSRDERGATAVEFGFVALPFLALMMALLEAGLLFFAAQTLDTATVRAARLIRTGQAQQQNFDADQFKERICDVVGLFMSCENLRVEVRTYTDFDRVDLSPPSMESGELPDDFAFEPGNGGDIVVVRAFYEWPVFLNLLGGGFAGLPNGNRLLIAAAAFRNEPFPWSSPPP